MVQSGWDIRGLWWNDRAKQIEAINYTTGAYVTLSTGANGHLTSPIAKGKAINNGTFLPTSQNACGYDWDDNAIICHYNAQVSRPSSLKTISYNEMVGARGLSLSRAFHPSISCDFSHLCLSGWLAGCLSIWFCKCVCVCARLTLICFFLF
jgi:hypothetical protein